MPASRLTAIASEINGLSPPHAVTESLMMSKAVNDATTAPKPTRLAVLKIGSNDALAPLSTVLVSFGSLFQLVAIRARIDRVSAAMIDQTPRTESIVVAPYCGCAR